MMKIALLAAFCFACAMCADVHVIKIVSQSSEVEPDGKYRYAFETEDGSKVGQEGELKVVDKDHSGESVKGYYEYKVGDQLIHSEYTADENGFVVKGDHIPPVPPYILRALEWSAAHPYSEDKPGKH